MDNLFEWAKQQVAQRYDLRYENGHVFFREGFDLHAFNREVFELGCNKAIRDQAKQFETRGEKFKESERSRYELNTFASGVERMVEIARLTHLPYYKTYIAHRKAIEVPLPELDNAPFPSVKPEPSK